jgi:6-phosphogluconolactonase
LRQTAQLSTVVLEDPGELARIAAQTTAEIIDGAIRARGTCYWALAGGETPRGCYEELGREPYRGRVSWDRVRFFWSDERLVPLDDPASNYAMAQTALLSRIRPQEDHVFPLQDPARYTELLGRLPHNGGILPRFDLIHLGMGEDGHTASLFPGDPALEEEKALVLRVRAPKPPPERLTLTLPVINAARQVLFLIQGAGKREALAQVLKGDASLPAGMVRPSDGQLRFLVERAAMPPG